MSRLQGWTAFDGLPGPDQVGANPEAGGQPQPQTQQHQQQPPRYNPLGNSPNSLNIIGNSTPMRIQPNACPPRTAGATPPQEEDERFLKPVAENKDPNPSQHPNFQHSQPLSNPQSPPQQQRPIGPPLGAFQISELPQSPNQLLMRNEYMQMRASPPASGASNHGSSPHVPNHAPMGFQSIQAMQGFQNMHPQYQQNGESALRFSRPSSGSPSPSQSPNQYHNQQQYGLPNMQDDVADMLAASHLDRPSSPQQRMTVRASNGSPPQPMYQQDQFADMQQQQQQQGGMGWQFPDVPPKGYKTVICKFWENNMCTKGSTCTFAHGTEDLKRFAGSGPAYRNMAGPGLPSALKMDRYKTKLCLFHMQSRCCKGPHCPYAHGMEELRASMPPGVLNALHNRFGLGAIQNPGGDFPGGPQDDQALRAYVDEVQLQQMLQYQSMQGLQGNAANMPPQLGGMQGPGMQGMGAGIGMQGGGMQNMPQQGMGGIPGMQPNMMQKQANMQGLQAMNQAGLQAMGAFGMGDANGGGGVVENDREIGDLEEQHQIAALQQHMNSLQQQAQARVNMQQQQQQQMLNPQSQLQTQGMMMQGGRGQGGPQGQQGQGGLPPSVLAYRPVNLWPHGPSWQPEEQ